MGTVGENKLPGCHIKRIEHPQPKKGIYNSRKHTLHQNVVEFYMELIPGNFSMHCLKSSNDQEHCQNSDPS